MPLPVELDRKNRNDFDELIEEAETLLAELDGHNRNHYSQYLGWVVKTSALITKLFRDSKQAETYQRIIEHEPPPEQSFVGAIAGYGRTSEDETSISSYTPPLLRPMTILKKLATLKGIRDSYVNGFYDGLEQQIIASVSADYMEQAEALLGEEIQVQYNHVVAAILCGVVLENRLRSYCEKHDPPLPTTKPNGDSKTMGALIDELDKIKAFDKQTRKLLKAWADIRNAAAHGRFDEFTREQVELMLLGANGFLANHL